MQTRKYPRTLQEAFGPYTDSRIEEPKESFDREDKLVMKWCAVIVIALAVIFSVWG